MDIEPVEGSGPASSPVGGPSVGPEPGSPEVTLDEVDQLLDEVEAALTRLDEGSYGACRTCGGPIGDRRLAALPTAQTCARCDGGGADPVDDLDGAAAGSDPEAEGEAGRDPVPAASPWSIAAHPEA